MSVEPRRGCGYRVVGGLYIVVDGKGGLCDRLPYPLESCRHCGQGIKQTRGHFWLAPDFFGPHLVESPGAPDGGAECPDTKKDPLCWPEDPALLLWVGEAFYPPPAHFDEEAAKMGISRRIAAVPRGFKANSTWVILAHPRIAKCDDCKGAGGLPDPSLPLDPLATIKCARCAGSGWIGGAFTAFRPSRIELLLKQSDATPERIEREAKRGITVVAVPDDDPDHNRQNIYEDTAERYCPACERNYEPLPPRKKCPRCGHRGKKLKPGAENNGKVEDFGEAA